MDESKLKKIQSFFLSILIAINQIFLHDSVLNYSNSIYPEENSYTTFVKNVLKIWKNVKTRI